VSLHSNHNIITGIMTELFGQEGRRMKSWVDRLCQQNSAYYADGRVGFLFEGQLYWPSTRDRDLDAVNKPIAEHLVPEIEAFLNDGVSTKLDQQLIKQSLFALLHPCQDKQGQRDSLPECLVTIVPEFRGMRRQDAEAWSIQGNARAVRQYERILPKIEMYVASRLIF
jgi:hypothetical protein